ncbi:hypothetical protein BGI08_10890 [Snodgrassella alvi]|nr:hypothetical protein BGI08_10890 [Snodgrassella alvi]
MKRNFDFLSTLSDFAELYNYCNEAEVNQKSDPKQSALNARFALEYTVKIIYILHNWVIPKRSSLFELVDNEDFRRFINDNELMVALHYIRRAGNNAAHLEKVTAKESLFSLLNLHSFVSAVLVKLGEVTDVATFDKTLLTENKGSISKASATFVEPKKKVIHKYREQIAEYGTLNAKNPQYFTEAETRSFYIDQQLREAGWEVLAKKNIITPSKACIEIFVEGMPSNSGEGHVDYVLFGRNGVPLALIEAKKTSKSVSVGKHQATLYADCLEKRYGERPVIYCSNGYETHLIDGLGYPSRLVFGFHTIDELELLIQRKKRKDITDLTIKNEITNRAYQKQAITVVCEHFNKKHRRALLVMATGTGKTRVAISLIELLYRNNWIKNVLFLADRTALVKQAHKNFTKLLPSVTTCILSDRTNKKRDLNARIMFSTYHTMIKHIDSDAKALSIGRFDLIIVDEAHRSIFGRFGAIFDYFDSLLLGLTATPREDIDRSTYQVFEAEQGIPNFSYELEEAIADKYLVPYKGFKRHSKHLRQGIKYDDLSQDEKDQLEKVWEYETTIHDIEDEDYKRDIANREMFNYIFNDNTIDKVLQDLMSNGLKVQSGERIGKTIIFAYNHKHAKQIVERFEKLYPQYGAEFCVLIDYSVNYAQNLIERFEVRDKDPQIAISVDMLDTGVDIPDLLNLVFFKEVKSKIKFMQMIGRGTRLSPDIFGTGADKGEFYIFDYCQNFEFFSLNPQGADAKATQSLTDRIFCLKSEIAFELQSTKYQEDEYARQLHDALKTELKGQIETLNPNHINVRKNRLYVDKFRLADSWQYLSLLDLNELKTYIAPILSPTQEDESAKKFDLLLFNIQLSLLNKSKKASKSQKSVINLVQALYEKGTIKEIKEKIAIIKEVLTDSFWQTLELDKLEHVRVELRDLIKHLKDDANGQTFNVDIEDFIEYIGETESLFSVKTYKQRVIDYLIENSWNPVIQKIRNLEPITRADTVELEKVLWNELGTREEYNKFTFNTLAGGNVAAFIRSIVGLDKQAAEKRFSQFLSDNQLNSQQQEYLKTIINYVNENGDITTDVLINESPFDSYDWQEVFGDNVAFISKYVNTLHSVIVAR